MARQPPDAPQHPIQGTAGDGLKKALALTWERRSECPGTPKVVNLVHDEIVVEIDEEHIEAGKVWLERCMIDGMAEVAGPAVSTSVEISVADRLRNHDRTTVRGSVPRTLIAASSG